ncbi:MAG: hypothetical protein ACR2KC_05160 [Acidimicrobiales bacterium]
MLADMYTNPWIAEEMARARRVDLQRAGTRARPITTSRQPPRPRRNPALAARIGVVLIAAGERLIDAGPAAEGRRSIA